MYLMKKMDAHNSNIKISAFKYLSLSIIIFFILFVFFPVTVKANKVCFDNSITDSNYIKALAEICKNIVPSKEVILEIKRLEKKYPDETSDYKYGRTGHQHTTFIVASLAGLKDRAYEIAYYSQFPDDEVRFSATMAAFYFWDLEYRERIMSKLHSLHGGNNNAVLNRRKNLKELLERIATDGQTENYIIGLIIHSFADSYAHVKEISNGELQAFDYVWGHLFHGHEPDIIANDPPRYKAYVSALYQVLSGEKHNDAKLKKLFIMIDQLKESKNKALQNFETYATTEHGFSFAKYDRLKKKYKKNNKVNKKDVKHVIGLIEQAVK